MIRPQVKAALWRWREVIAAAVIGGVGLWFIRLGGLILIPAGAGILVLATALGLNAWRRMRFGQGIGAPGVVEVDEGQISYMGPEIGGFVSLPELVEIKLITLRGRRMWRLKQADGQAILVPVDAAGADRLFDAFASLPGLDTADLVAVLGPDAMGDGQLPAPDGLAGMRMVWRRPGTGVVTRP